MYTFLKGASRKVWLKKFSLAKVPVRKPEGSQFWEGFLPPDWQGLGV